MKEKIWLSSPHMSAEGYELQYVHEAFETNWLSPLGPNVESFEKEFGDYINLNGVNREGSHTRQENTHCVALSSGTSALHLALLAEGVGEGDIVLCPSLTFSGSVNPIRYLRANPYFIDSDYSTWNMDVNLLEEAFAKTSNVKAVVVVHIYGLPADMNPIVELCSKHRVPLIEDAAESLGSYYGRVHTGTIANSGIFSFNGNKIITTSGGGMYVTKDASKAQKVRFWATQAREPALHYEHNELGYNYRMSNVLAGMGRGQLKVLSDRVKKKKYLYDSYKAQLDSMEDIGWMPENEWAQPNHWLSCITLPDRISPTKIIGLLADENIEARPTWKPMHLQPYYRGYGCMGGKVSEDLFTRGICLPSDTKMSDQDIERVVDVVRKAWKLT